MGEAVTKPESLLDALKRLDRGAYRAPWDIAWTRDCLIDDEDGYLIVALRNHSAEIIEAFELLDEFAVTSNIPAWADRAAALLSKVSGT